MNVLACSFIGHRKIEITEELIQKVREVVENLIVKNNVSTFLFGSNSEFNSLCHSIVTELKEKYSDIKRIAYTCKSEAFIFERERQRWEELYSKIEHGEIHLLGFEDEFEHKTKYISGRASYIERNRAMIDNSDYCVFYYDEKYQPKMRKYSKRSISDYQPQSGTRLAYNYAKKKGKIVINIKLL